MQEAPPSPDVFVAASDDDDDADATGDFDAVRGSFAAMGCNLAPPAALPTLGSADSSLASLLLGFAQSKPAQALCHAAAFLSLLTALVAAFVALLAGAAPPGSTLGAFAAGIGASQRCSSCLSARALHAAVVLVAALCLYAGGCRVLLFKLAPYFNINTAEGVRAGLCWPCCAPLQLWGRCLWPRAATGHPPPPPLVAPLALLARCACAPVDDGDGGGDGGGGGGASDGAEMDEMEAGRGVFAAVAAGPAAAPLPPLLTVRALVRLRRVLRVVSAVAFALLAGLSVAGVALLLLVSRAEQQQQQQQQQQGGGADGARCVALCSCASNTAAGLAPCSTTLLQIEVRALVVAVPYLYLVLFKFSRDLTEEASKYRRKMAQKRGWDAVPASKPAAAAAAAAGTPGSVEMAHSSPPRRTSGSSELSLGQSPSQDRAHRNAMRRAMDLV